MDSAVQVRGISHHYGGVTALHDLDVDVPTGVTAVLGPNGAGKSTLLGLLSTALRVQRGTVRIDGVDSRRETKRYRRMLGFLPQTFTLPTNLTVAEFLTLTAWYRLVPTRERAGAVAAALEAVDLADRADTRISQLSGGMHRRVGIAQAIVNRPRVLLLDEPTVGLDPRQRRGLRDLIPALGGDCAVVLSTHLTEDVAAMADRVAVLDEGALLFSGTIAEFTAGRDATAANVDTAYEALTEGDLR
jgi:ABC-2 type transport system ATP-binding protein